MYPFENVPLGEYMYLVFTPMPGESYRRRLVSLLYLCYVFWALINSPLCWFLTRADFHQNVWRSLSYIHASVTFDPLLVPGKPQLIEEILVRFCWVNQWFLSWCMSHLFWCSTPGWEKEAVSMNDDGQSSMKAITPSQTAHMPKNIIE